MRKLLESPLTVSLGEALTVLPEVSKTFTNLIRDTGVIQILNHPEKQHLSWINESHIAGPETTDYFSVLLSTEKLDKLFGNTSFYKSECPRISARIGSLVTQVLLDSRAKVNVIRNELAN